MDNEFKARLDLVKTNNKKKIKHLPGQHWPIEKKIEVVTQYLLIGNLKLVAASCGIAYDVAKSWKRQPWWIELEAEIRQTENIEMDTKLSKIVERSLDATLDRVENGDFFYDQKTGQVKRKPANLRDVARVGVDILSKRELLRGNATERKETTQTAVVDQLKLLAAEFAKWQNPKHVAIDVDVTDVTPHESQDDAVEMVEVIEDDEDALHEERETGLQTGSGEVHEQTGSNQEEDGAERSSEGNGEEGPSP